METNQTPVEPNKTPASPTPGREEQSVQPNKPDTEINPAKQGNNTEVDLDKSKIETYPDKDAPKRQ